MRHDLLVVVPTYNEVENLEDVVDRIRSTGASVLIVDDASPDGTGDLADRLAAGDECVAALHRPGKQGLGAAYADGFAAALDGDAVVIGQMDADLSHDPADLPRLFDAVVAGSDVAVGSRYVAGGSTEGWSWVRRAMSRGANWYTRLALGLRTRDATAGFRAYRAEALRRLEPATCKSAGYVFQVEMTYRAERRGMEIVEVPITFIERHRGDSKMSLAVAFEAMWRITRWGLRRLWRRLRSAA